MRERSSWRVEGDTVCTVVVGVDAASFAGTISTVLIVVLPPWGSIQERVTAVLAGLSWASGDVATLADFEVSAMTKGRQ